MRKVYTNLKDDAKSIYKPKIRCEKYIDKSPSARTSSTQTTSASRTFYIYREVPKVEDPRPRC